MNPLAIFNRNTALGISLTYLVVAGLWIFFSDHALLWAVGNPAVVAELQSLKGFVFVLVTAIFLYWLVQHRLPMAAPSLPPRTRYQWLTLALLTLAICVAGYALFSVLRSSVRHDVQNNLRAVAELKRQHLEYWLDERRADAMLSAGAWQADHQLLDWLATDKDEARRFAIRQRLQENLRAYGYNAIAIYDATAKPRLNEGDPEETPGSHRDIAMAAMRTRMIQLVDFDIHMQQGRPVFGFMAPLISDGQAVGAMFFSIHPDEVLYKLVEQWPTASSTAETMLVREEHNQIRYLTRLRHLDIPLMSLALPLNNSERSSATAATGKFGLIEGKRDYRNEKVLTYASPIKGTTWLLICKIDEREAYAEIYAIDFGTFLVMLATIFMSVALLRNRWRSQTLHAQLNLLGSEHQRESLAQQLDLLSRFANDIIIIMTLDGTLVTVNDRALEIYGFTREDLPHLHGEILRAPGSRDTYHELLDNIQRLKSMRYETVHQRKDGSTLPVEVNARLIDVGDQTYIHIVMHDITERKAAEANILRLNRLYAAINQANQAIARCTDEDTLFSLVCRHIVELGGMKLAWVGLVDADGMVRPAASFGSGTEYLKNINISINAESPNGHGPTGTAIREDHPYWCQDFLHDNATGPWHERGNEYGWHGSASLPIHRNGAAIGSITMYAADVNAFDQAARNLLEQLATDVSLSLDRFDANQQRTKLQSELESAKTRLSHIIDVNPALLYMLAPESRQEGRFVISLISGRIQAASGYSIEHMDVRSGFLVQARPPGRSG
jgi:PAS domain S-box-containing protein